MHETSPLLHSDPPLHPSALVAVSFAAAQAASRVLHKPLWLHLADSFKIMSDNTSHFSIPLPISTVIAGGQLGCGKLKLRGFCLSSLPSCNLQEQVKNITATYREVGRLLAAKPGGVSHRWGC